MNSQPQPHIARNSIILKRKIKELTIHNSQHSDDERWISEWVQNGTLATE